MAVQLTPHQQEKFDEIIKLLKAGETRIVLQGSAGCGKTVLASEIVRYCCKDRTVNPKYNNGQVFVTAPTNKALAVLKSKIDSPVQFKTIHSALKISRWIDPKTGVEKFMRQNKGSYSRQDEFLSCKVCIEDECSMIPNAFIGGKEEIIKGQKVFVRGYTDDVNVPIIFIGDEKQLNPVGEQYSPAFHQNWPTVELTEIIRQGKGNPIIDLSRDLDMIYFKTPSLNDGKGYIYDNNKGQIIADLAEVNGTDEYKYIAWTNADVNEMNKLVREARYGRPKKVEKQETLVFNSPFGSFFTNQEIRVDDLAIYTDNVYIPRHDTRYDSNNQPISALDNIKMKFYVINDKIKVIHEDSEIVFRTIFNSLLEKCKLGWDYRGKYYFAEQFADITYNHAITVHKSQGSTYKTTVVNVGNVDFNRNMPERQRMLYTAVTRASDLLILYNVK